MFFPSIKTFIFSMIYIFFNYEKGQNLFPQKNKITKTWENDPVVMYGKTTENGSPKKPFRLPLRASVLCL